jgi:1,4-alpha-glucan branching enzyme
MNTMQEKSSDGVYSARNSIKQINFCCAARGAKAVHLVGDFNHWHPILMRQSDNGWWFIQVWLPHGHHQYRFLVDGEPTLDLYSSGTGRDERGLPASLIAVS